jgi:putative two-component system response regulator
LADAYDAMTSERVYKAQLPHEKAVEIIAEAKGLQFDPDVVDAFLQVKENFRSVALKYADLKKKPVRAEVKVNEVFQRFYIVDQKPRF